MINKKNTLLIIFIIFILLFVTTGCSNNDDTEDLVLRIYNCQDYIDEGLNDEGKKVSTSIMEDWASWYYEEYGVEVSFVYDTFETNESMLNTLKTGKSEYDLVCPSDYAIQKMISLDMLEKIDFDLKDDNNNNIITNYNYISSYLIDLFKEKGWDEYSIPYMWGTVGFIYNMDQVTLEEVSTWNVLWDTEVKATAKDSIRDTYMVGVMYVYQDELNSLKSKLDNNEITLDYYTSQVGKIMNRCDEDTLAKVEKALIEMKNNIYGFEVDSGKNDIVTGKIGINLAWSGDAVYSMDIAEEEEDVLLGYAVPNEGSNVWFDGWVMPKGANKKLAQSFVNYLCSPESAMRNMEYIGYTSPIVSDEMYDMIIDWYGVEDGEEGYDVDLTYLFGDSLSEDYYTIDEETNEKRVIVTIAERGRQFDCQYPDEETISRCGIMEDFGSQNDKVIAMWENVKIGDIPIWITIVLVSVIVLAIAGLYIRKAYVKYQRIQRRLRKQTY